MCSNVFLNNFRRVLATSVFVLLEDLQHNTVDSWMLVVLIFCQCVISAPLFIDHFPACIWDESYLSCSSLCCLGKSFTKSFISHILNQFTLKPHQVCVCMCFIIIRTPKKTSKTILPHQSCYSVQVSYVYILTPQAQNPEHIFITHRIWLTVTLVIYCFYSK